MCVALKVPLITSGQCLFSPPFSDWINVFKGVLIGLFGLLALCVKAGPFLGLSEIAISTQSQLIIHVLQPFSKLCPTRVRLDLVDCRFLLYLNSEGAS